MSTARRASGTNEITEIYFSFGGWLRYNKKSRLRFTNESANWIGVANKQEERNANHMRVQGRISRNDKKTYGTTTIHISLYRGSPTTKRECGAIHLANLRYR